MDLDNYIKFNPNDGTFTYLYKSSNQNIGHTTKGIDHGNGYLIVSVKGKKYKAHRLAFYLSYRYWPEQVDHSNGIKNDNRLVNLREVDNQKNQWNAEGRDSKSGYKNVYWREQRKKWQVKIPTLSGIKYIGSFDTVEEANAAAIAARKKYQEEYNIDVRSI